MSRNFTLCGMLFVAVCAAAQSLKLDSLRVGSKTYSNVTVMGMNSTDLYFKHRTGMSNVKLKYLDPALQKKFDYDPKLAAQAEREQEKDNILYQTILASNISYHAVEAARAAGKTNSTSEDSLMDPVTEVSMLGKKAPPLEVEKWLTDKPDATNKTVLVAFWAPWSIPCQKWVGDLNALQKRFAEKLVVIAITSESQQEVESMGEPKIAVASGLDPKGKLGLAFGVTSVPYALLLDAKGVIRYQGHPAAITPEKMQSFIAKQQPE